MAGSKMFVMPSGNESFSIVTLEAMVQRAPVLASGVSEVMVDHVTTAAPAEFIGDYETFAAALNELLHDDRKLAEMGELGRDYVLARFTRERVREALLEAVNLVDPEKSAYSCHTFSAISNTFLPIGGVTLDSRLLQSAQLFDRKTAPRPVPCCLTGALCT